MQLLCSFITTVLLLSGLDPGFSNWGT